MRVPSFALALVAAVLVSCTSVQPEGAPTVPPPITQQPPPDAAELMYLVNTEDGSVFLEVPPEILADVRTELVRHGREDVARQLEKLYDLQTGFVRDPAHAKKAEERLRGGKR